MSNWCESVHGKSRHQTKVEGLTHGDKNTYYPGMPETIRNNLLDKTDSLQEYNSRRFDADHNVIKDACIMELEKENNVFDSNNNQLKRRAANERMYPKSLLNKVKTMDNTRLSPFYESDKQYSLTRDRFNYNTNRDFRSKSMNNTPHGSFYDTKNSILGYKQVPNKLLKSD